MSTEELQSYLALNYMSGPKAEAILTSKKHHSKTSNKKHKSHSQNQHAVASTSGWILKDPDEINNNWNSISKEDDPELEPVVENLPNFKSKKSSESKWEIIKSSTNQQNESEMNQEEREAEDEKPQIVELNQGGLQTAAQIKKKLGLNQPRNLNPTNEEPEEETIYRDANGKKIDTKQMRADEKRRQARELEKKMKKMEWGKGLVQRNEHKKDIEELSKIASQPFARTIDDKELNDELKDKQRWNDPAAAFLTKSTSSSTKSSRPKYNGPPPPPNRYNIPPGFRWDGVDRSNGFEKKLFQTNNDQKRLRTEAYNYSVDEM